MSEEKDCSDKLSSLRKRALERLSESEQIINKPEEAMELIEELRTHQIELQIQNEELRMAQQQLIESRENYISLFQFAPVPYLTIDEHNSITVANRAATGFFKKTHHQLINQPISSYIEDQSLSVFYACRNEALRSNSKKSGEVLFKHDISPLTVLFTIAVNKTRMNSIQFRIMLNDITQQKENERALAHSKYVSSIIETVNNGLVVLSGNDLRIEMVNKAFYSLLSITAEETLGLKLQEFKNGLLNDKQLVSGLTHTLYGGEDLTGLNLECYLPQTGFRQLLLSARPIDSTDLMREKVLLVIEDITERNAAENKIRELNKTLIRRADELAYSNKEMESFIYSVSHDLRAPLRTISGFTEIIRDEFGPQLDDTGKDYLRRVINGTAKMSRLIDDLLRLSRVSRHELHISTVNLSDMVKVILDELHSASPERNAEFFIQESIEVHADPDLLRIAIENILKNAWKYTGKNKHTKIEFGTKKVHGSNAFFIRDNGVGFRNEYAEKIFNPFQRLHVESEFPGTGIGLAIVKRVIEKHGGSIWATGEPKEGATIFFSLPV